jgi:hypothetical protein
MNTEVEQGASGKHSMEELEALITACVKARECEDAAQAEVDKYKAERHRLEEQIQNYLEYFGKNKYIGVDGNIEIRERASFRTPKTEEAKKAFISWLDSKGIALQYLTVNSQSLNGLLKSELETAQAEGRELHVPGIQQPTLYKTVIVRKAK